MTAGIPWRLRFWGVRGSAPTPGRSTMRYGGNTACLALEPPVGKPGASVVLDAGTGIRLCGLARKDAGVTELDLLLSHTHWDHVQGFPFLPLLYQERATVRVTGPGPGLAEAFDRLLAPPMWPVETRARLEFRELVSPAGNDRGGGLQVGGWTVRAVPLAHPGPTVGYRLERAGSATVAYLTDNELAGGHGRGADWLPKLVDFVRGANLLVHDATNAPDQEDARRGWGHSSALEAVTLAARAGCRRVVLFHYDPAHPDGTVDMLVSSAKRHAAALAPGLVVEAAFEGMTLTLEQEE